MKQNTKISFINFLLLLLISGFCCQTKPPTNENNPVEPQTPANTDVTVWMTKSDQSSLLQKQNTTLNFAATVNQYPTIEIDTTSTFQTIDGFGFSLTGGSADLINALPASQKQTLLRELFSNESDCIGISYLRVSVGASDLNAQVFSYDDMPTGQTDVNLQHFNLSYDTINLIPVLKDILAINPNIKIMGSPWSPPTWMKDNNNSMGGSLLPQYHGSYANYFVKYIQAMQSKGITIDAITIQNEPLHGGNNPSMVMQADQQAAFIKNNLGPAFQSAGINTKIIIWDHNCDNPNYPIQVLNDAGARPFINGSAFHLYGGDISALNTVHYAYPDKNLYFTEQWTGAQESFAENLKWHFKNVVIGSMRNWSRVALEWNLASDPTYNPHTLGGCTECKGALTIGTGITRNVSYYIIAQASKFVPPGSVRIASNIYGSIQDVAFKRPDGKKVLIVVNDGTTSQMFNIKFNGKWVTTSLDAGAVGTYVW